MNNSSETANSTQSGEDDPDAYLYDVAKKVYVYSSPVIVVVGIVGNGLVLLTMRRPKLRRSPASLIMATLAVFDTVVLLLDFLNNWLSMGFNKYLLSNKGFCLFHRWLFEVSFTVASWLVAALAVERFVVVWFPLKARVLCTYKSAVVTVTLLPAVCAAMMAFHFSAWHVTEDGACDIHPRIRYFMSYIYPWFTAAFYSYIPSTIIICSNVAIVVKLKQARRQRKVLTSAELARARARQGADPEDGDDTFRLTVVVLAVSVSFLLLTLPVVIWYIVVFALGNFISSGPKMQLAEVCILVWALLNFCNNFFLYIMASRTIRRELFLMLGFRKRSRYPGGAAAEHGGSVSGVSEATSGPALSVTSASATHSRM